MGIQKRAEKKAPKVTREQAETREAQMKEEPEMARALRESHNDELERVRKELEAILEREAQRESQPTVPKDACRRGKTSERN